MQGNTWAAALRKGLSENKSSGQQVQPVASKPVADVIPSAAPPPAENIKAAARQKLLAEALKSRANALTGERRCLGCGRAFQDLSRFAQHIADKHNGVNSSSLSELQPSSAAGGGGGGIVAFPPLQLSDVAVVLQKSTFSAPVTLPASSKQQQFVHPSLRPSAVQKQSKYSQVLKKKAPTAAAFQAPEGTHAKRKKRPSRLKRNYQRAKLEEAVAHWTDVLATVEEALQIAGELQGAVLNEIHAVEAALLQLHSDRSRSSSHSMVRLQVLREQARGAGEKVEQLMSVHGTARAHLMKSQSQLLPVHPSKKSAGFFLIEQGAAAEVGRVEKEAEKEKKVRGDVVEEKEEEVVPFNESDGTSASENITSNCTNSNNNNNNNNNNFSTNNNSPETVAVVAPVSDVVVVVVEDPLLRSNESSSSDDDSDGSSFGMQWGDTLRTWATKVGVDAQNARASLGFSVHQQQQQEEEEQGYVGVVDDTMEKVDVAHGAEKKKDEALPAAAAAAATAAKDDDDEEERKNSFAAPTVPVLSPPGIYNVQAWLEKHQLHNDAATVAVAVSNSLCLPLPPLPPALPASSIGAVAVGEDINSSILLSTAPPTTTTNNNNLFCPLCTVTANGPRAWQDHLSSRRHASKVAQAAKSGITTTEVVSTLLLYSTPSAPPPPPLPPGAVTVEEGKRIQSHTPLQPQKRYTGTNADVAPYVDHIITPELNTAVDALMRQLLEWQERARRLDPVNARRKRRVLSGMREVEKSVKTNKAKLLLVAPNIGALKQQQQTPKIEEDDDEEEVETQQISVEEEEDTTTTVSNGDDVVYPISSTLEMAKERNIPIVFALSRQRMGKLLGPRKSASVFSILDASGAETLFAQVVAAAAMVAEK